MPSLAHWLLLHILVVLAPANVCIMVVNKGCAGFLPSDKYMGLLSFMSNLFEGWSLDFLRWTLVCVAAGCLWSFVFMMPGPGGEETTSQNCHSDL